MHVQRVVGFHLFHAGRKRDVRTLYFVYSHGKSEENNLIYIRKGRLFLETLGRKITAGEGSCLCVDPRRVGSCRSAPSEAVSYDVLSFKLTDIDGGSPRMTDLGFPIAWKVTGRRPFEAALDAVFSLWSGKGKYAVLDCSAAGLNLLKVMAEGALPGSGKSSAPYEEIDKRIDEVLMLLHSNYKRTYTVDSLARRVSLHPVYFTRLFRKATGLSPNRYMLEQKIEKAKQMMTLMDDPDPPKSAAMELGFDYYPGFYRTFKRITGMGPREYCRRMLGSRK
jgi:AraC-like DNA-binding protein